MKNTNEFEKYIKQINRINTIRRGARVLVRVLVLAIVFGGLGYIAGQKHGQTAGLVDGVEALQNCLDEDGRGYFVGQDGQFVCIYE